MLILDQTRENRQRTAFTAPIFWQYFIKIAIILALLSGESAYAAQIQLPHHRQRGAVDDADFEGQRIETFDAAEIDAVAVLVAYPVADVHKDPAGFAEVVVQYFLVPDVYAQIARNMVRREICRWNIA